jgi:hypothetical protein
MQHCRNVAACCALAMISVDKLQCPKCYTFILKHKYFTNTELLNDRLLQLYLLMFVRWMNNFINSLAMYFTSAPKHTRSIQTLGPIY